MRPRHGAPVASVWPARTVRRIRSERDDETPLVVQGAGPGMTVAGLPADLVEAAERIP